MTGALLLGAFALGLLPTSTGAQPAPTGATGTTGATGATGSSALKLLTNAPACAPGPGPAATTTTTSTTSTTTSTTTTSSTTTTLAGTTTTLPSATTTSTLPTTTTAAAGATTTTIPTSTPGASTGYYLVTLKGSVSNYGGAAFFGSKSSHPLPAPVVAAAATDDGGGYWLATAAGNLYNFGDAAFVGSPVHHKLPRPIVAFATSPDGGGYWFVEANGALFNYGDAAFCGSAIHKHLSSPVTAMAPTPDGEGYWLVDAKGQVLSYGDAPLWGSDPVHPKKVRIIGIEPTPDGGGYWLAGSNGSVYNYGDAAFYGSLVHTHLRRPVVSFGVTPDGGGYWLATANGRIFNFGDALFHGSLAAHPPRHGDAVVAFVRAYALLSASSVPLPHHVIGYDISNFQCAKPGSSALQASMPTSSEISVLEVAGWLDGANNSCLAAEAAWAKQTAGSTGASYQLYLFLNSPGTNKGATATYSSGPKGTCGTLSGSAQQSCIAYNYGYNGAKAALAYAMSEGVSSTLWWVDVENASLSSNAFSDFSADKFWSYSTALNAQTIEGAIDALHQAGLVVGIYSTSIQYPKIAGDLVPGGGAVPLWIAGAPWTKPPFSEGGLPSTSTLVSWCAGSAVYSGTNSDDLFAGGTPWILQETPGVEASPYGLDPDYTC